MTVTEKTQRPIRSFVLRQGHITKGQQKALKDSWSQYGERVFERVAPLILEIGFGMGDHLVEQASKHSDCDFIGIEVHPPGIGSCIVKARECGLNNLKIYAEDAVTILNQNIEDKRLDKVILLFPDPWPKTKHHKRRIVQPDFVKLVAEKLKVGGLFQLATDWQPYADHMLAVLNSSPYFKNVHENGFAPPSDRTPTKFEKRAQRKGFLIWELLFQKRTYT